MSGLVQQIDKALNRYYGHKGKTYVNDEGVGRFAEWVEDNGYDTEQITEEFQSNEPQEISFIDFDQDFPTHNTSNDKRTIEIFKVLYACYKEPAAFFSSPDLPDMDEFSSFTNQIEMAKHQSLVEQNDNKQYQYGANDDDPHISYVDKPTPTPKPKPAHELHGHPPNEVHGHPPDEYPNDHDMDDIYDGNGYEDMDYYDRDMRHMRDMDMRHMRGHTRDTRDTPPKQSKIRRNTSKATEPVYESQLAVSNLSISLIRDAKLRNEYETVIDLQDIGNKAFGEADYRNALKYYTQMIMHLGSNGVRKISDFCNDTGNPNPLQDTNIVYKGIDKLRMSAYIRMAAVYKKQNKWDKVIEHCSKVLDGDDSNVLALLNRGSAYRKRKQFEEAKTDLEKAKKSQYVDINIEKELSSLNRNMAGKFSDSEDNEMAIGGSDNYSFMNTNWPQLPLRDIIFEQWIDGTYDHNKNMQYEILYPVPVKTNQYKLYSNQEMLDMAILWLDIDVIIKLINLNIFDINQQNKPYKLQTYLNQLSTGKLMSGLTYANNMAKFVNVLSILCGNNDIDMELRDMDDRTPLANAIKHNMNDLGNTLLRFGANVNDGSVKLEIETNRNNNDVKDIIRQSLGVLRENSLNAIEYVISSTYGITENTIVIATEILDCILSAWKADNSVDDID